MTEHFGNRIPDREPHSALPAGGVGIGTAMVSIANAVGPSSVTGMIFLYLAPVATIAFGPLFSFLDARATRFFQLRLAKKVRKSLIARLGGSDDSARHKVAIRKKIEELDMIIIADELGRIAQLGHSSIVDEAQDGGQSGSGTSPTSP